MFFRKSKATGTIVAALIASMMLSACSGLVKGDSKTGGKSASDGSFEDVGFYTIYAMEDEEQEYSRKDLKEIGREAIYLWLEDDGTGELFMIDDLYDLEWEDGRILDLDGEKATYKMDEGKLSFSVELDGEDYSFTFKFKDVEKPEDAGVVEVGDGDEEDADADDDKKDNKKDDDSKASKPAGTGSRDYIGLSGDIGEMHVEVTGAQYVVNNDGQDSVRFYIDLTNNSGETVAPGSAVSMEVTQGGVRLNSTYVSKDEYEAKEDDMRYVKIRPGITTRYANVYTYNPQGGTIDVSIYEGYGQNKKELAFSLEPDSLTDERPEPLVAKKVSDPQWTKGLMEGNAMSTVDGSKAYILVFTKIEGAFDYRGNPLVRVYYEVENIGKESINTRRLECDIEAYHDGFELESGYAKDQVNEERNVGMDLEPGKKITLAECFELRDDSVSPVEVEMSSYDEGALAGFTAGFKEDGT